MDSFAVWILSVGALVASITNTAAGAMIRQVPAYVFYKLELCSYITYTGFTHHTYLF